MKKILSVIIFSMFVSDAFADDWRMRKFDLNNDNVISEAELIQVGCVRTTKLFDRADRNGDDVLNRKEARKATYIIFKNRRVCPAILKPAVVRG
tara:strand:+ start:1391 stop:1672 length:282 start_codon:yes stop_codon:yes gene_type:complete